ncbi:PREDICTED: gustatory receptor for bitter taste 66a-like [Rhagoletis zephyria]|uniref:gustatory receptor for bitter taste 66a-like n=1 Tax=Rhagoletis zephyria TaxID=28612 RepID=UPI0008117CBD|nr:PREDICTED: gustatory receptor for bitter taste 66a-like [Rhagoletis zephyria]
MFEVKLQSKPLLQSFNSIFYWCKLLGVYPYDFQKFYYDGVLQSSTVGSCVVIIVMCFVFMLYNLMLFTFAGNDVVPKYNHLNLIVVIALTYISPVMMMVDQITAIRNQNALPALFERIEYLDEGLRQLGISVDNKHVQRRIRLMIAVTVLLECCIFAAYIWLQVDVLRWTLVLWIFASTPTFYNTLDKIWFMGILLGLRDRFDAINETFDTIAGELEKNCIQSRKKQRSGDVALQPSLSFEAEDIGHIKLENLVRNAFGELIRHREPFKRSAPKMRSDAALGNFDVLQERFISLCQLHESTCRIAKLLNELWRYPILILMAYGFVVITSQLYFTYCATQSQPIPVIFRSAEQLVITALSLIYLGGKCTSLMFFSWKTSQASRRTGICLHKCGVAADTNEVYEIVNHLSLKLFNHAVNFSACGFFTLDMGTLYAVCGAITSYLIILIQFNLAGQQVKIKKELAASNETALMVLDAENYTVTPTESTTHWD